MRYEVHVPRDSEGQDEAHEHNAHEAQKVFRELKTCKAQEHVGDEVREA